VGHGHCHTFLFADLVGFTTFTDLHGDEAAADLAVLFSTAAGALAREHGLTVVKCLGDGVMLRADDAGRAVRLGLHLHEDLAARAGMLPVHAGAHTGCAVERGGDWFGAAVNLAARVADAARAGELLVTESTVRAAGHLRGVRLESLGPRLFRNVTSATEIYSAREAAPGLAPAPVRVPLRRRAATQPAAA
jgi:adenylate cyclase